MSIEFIRVKLNHRGAPARQLTGGLIVHGDGSADFFRDATQHAESISAVLDAVELDAPFSRVRVEDLTAPTSCADCDLASTCGPTDCVRVDVVAVGERRLVGPLLLRRGMTPAISGEITADIAAVIARELRAFQAARRATTKLRAVA